MLPFFDLIFTDVRFVAKDIVKFQFVVLNCSYLAMERMLKEVKILKKDETSCII